MNIGLREPTKLLGAIIGILERFYLLQKFVYIFTEGHQEIRWQLFKLVSKRLTEPLCFGYTSHLNLASNTQRKALLCFFSLLNKLIGLRVSYLNPAYPHPLKDEL